MLKVLTAEQMCEVDRLTTEMYGIPSILLMENAAHAVARVIVEKLGGSVKGKSIVVLCGKGNNGGDGAALARILWTLGANCFVYLFAPVSNANANAEINFNAINRISESRDADWPNENCLDFYENAEFPDLQPEDSIVVDALFGTGLKGVVNGQIGDVVARVRQNSIRGPQLYISIDLPSGLVSDLGAMPDIHVQADVTVTLTSPKPANVLSPAYRSNGELIVANIGSPPGLIDEQASLLFLAERSDAISFLRKAAFTTASYKNKRGHALVIGGSRHYSGAAVLVGNASMRTGVGLVTVAVPEGSRDGVISRAVPEVMVRGISQTDSGSAAEKAADEVNELLGNVDCVAIGSGLSSKEDETKRFVRRVVEERRTPVVIDADALTSLSPWTTKGSDNLPLILTPHEGEFKRMLGVEGNKANGLLKDHVGAVREFATTHNIFLVLKGERSLIGSPDGRVVVNPTGNPGLGKAGNGDTLTGIIAGFVAQAGQMEIDMLETLVAALYIAGMAGDGAAKKFGKRAMTASDVRDCLADVFAELEPS